MTINEFHRIFNNRTETKGGDYGRPIPRVVCKDGLSMSIQAGSGKYSNPREDFLNFYSKFEIGFPSAKIDELMQYTSEPENPTEAVYAYVPAELIDEILENHGGIDLNQTLDTLFQMHTESSRLAGIYYDRAWQALEKLLHIPRHLCQNCPANAKTPQDSDYCKVLAYEMLRDPRTDRITNLERLEVNEYRAGLRQDCFGFHKFQSIQEA